MELRPVLDLLVRVDAHARVDHRLVAEDHLVADRDTLVQTRMRANVAAAPDDRALDDRGTADVGARVDDRARHARVLAQRHAGCEDTVGVDLGVRRDPAVAADEGRPFDLLDAVELDALADPDVAADADAWDLKSDLLVERVEVRLAELVEVADVLPVAVADVAVDRPAHLEQQREELLGEVVRPVLRDVLQHLRLEHVDAGVDRVGEDLAPRRLLEEALDAPVLVGDDDAELERVVNGLEADRHRGPFLAVRRDESSQVDVAERVAGDDEERVVEPTGGAPHGAGGAKRRLLDRVADVDTEGLAAAEIAPDRLWQESNGDDHVLEAVALEELDDVLHARLADDRHHRLRLVRGQRP